jgi:hypothetical protein
MNDFVTSNAGVCLISVAIGVGVGLMVEPRSRRSWLGSLLVTAVYVVLMMALLSNSVWAVPVFVISMGVTVLVCETVRYSQSPLLVGEPAWRKLFLVFAHGQKVRFAADVERAEALQRT